MRLILSLPIWRPHIPSLDQLVEERILEGCAISYFSIEGSLGLYSPLIRHP